MILLKILTVCVLGGGGEGINWQLLIGSNPLSLSSLNIPLPQS